MRRCVAVAAAVAVVAGCGPPDGRERFERDVVPVLEGYCAAASCHGVAPGARDRGEVVADGYFVLELDERGVIADLDRAYERTLTRINTVEEPELSSLLRKPLSVAGGGTLHQGGTQFRDREDPSWRALSEWVAHETGGGEGAPYDQLTALEQQFADEVLPQLAARQCTNQACHGEVAPFTAFPSPIAIDGVPVFGTEGAREAYAAARMHLSLTGDPAQSRLLRKGLPLGEGGIIHRGGNDFFRPEGAAAEAILRWAEAETTAAIGEPPRIEGVVFVRGPLAPEPPFAHGGFTPGTDVYVLAPASPDGELRNLTAAAHPGGPADVRDPAVRHDAGAIAFAMRTSPDDGFNIYEIAVDGTGLRQLTFDEAQLPGGGVAANVQPTYGPDGRIYFTSTRAGYLADGLDELDSEIWAVAPATGALERITYDPSAEITPGFIGTGKTYGTLSFTMRRTVGGRYEAPVFRMPLDHNRAYHGDPEIHIHHGVTPDEEIVYGMRTLPDGRFVCALIDRDNLWRGGRLAIFDRQLGPELPAGAEDEASVGGFRHAFAVVDPDAASSGVSEAGLYRRPVPLPDGSILVSHAPGPLDLSSPESEPELGIYRLVLATGEDGAPRLGSLERVIDEPGVAEYDAEPLVCRPLEDDPSHEPAWDPTRSATTGLLALRHVETLEAIFSNLEQRGAKRLRDDLVYARLIEALPITPDQLSDRPAGPGPHLPGRILAELPLAGGSVYARVPADTPFRVQFLDRDRMAIGAQQNRWIHVAPDETFPGGVAPSLYPTLCAGCHGSLSGAPGDLGGPVPDAVTSASMTLATHRNLDPRRPLEPTELGAPIDVDYRDEIAPLIARSCAGCHGGDEPAGSLDLTGAPAPPYDTAYLALLDHVDAAGSSARRSPLVERVLGRELDADAPMTGHCPGEPALTEDEVLVLIRWIDLGASYRGGQP